MATTTTHTEGFEGFITSSKGITLSIVSLGVWGFTLIFYRMAAAIFGEQVGYETFCLFTSFLLSLVLGIYISRGFYSKTDKFRLLAIGLNVLLIYTSANGIQAGNANFTKAVNAGTETTMSLFGLLDARPWLPDATSRQEIANNRQQISSLQNEVASLHRNNASLNAHIQELKRALDNRDYTGKLREMAEENQHLRAQNDALSAELDALHNRPIPGNQDAELQRLQQENTKLNNQLNDLYKRIEGYNAIRNEWTGKAQTDSVFSRYAQTQRKLWQRYFGRDYYQDLFYYSLPAGR